MRSAEHLPMKAYEKDESKKEWCPVHEYRLESSNKKERRFAKKFSTDRTTESWELMKTWRNKATRLRRKAIKDYWNGVSGKLDKNPKKFFGTFMPFIISKCAKDKDSTDISLHIQGQLQQNKQIVEEEFTRYLSTTADNIEGMGRHAWLKKSVTDTLGWVRSDTDKCPVLLTSGALAKRKFWTPFGVLTLVKQQGLMGCPLECLSW